MNILLISYDYPPYPGGVAKVSYQVASQLHRMGENVTVMAQRIKGDRELDKNNKFLTYRLINIFFLRELALILLLPYLIVKHKIDIIYILIWCQGGIATFLAAKLLNIPYVINANGLELIDYKKTLLDKIKYSLFRKQYKRLIFENAKRVIAISNYTKNMVIKVGAKENRVDIILPGININRFKPNLDATSIILRHKLENKKILMTVARIQEYKGHDTVIKLMPELLKKMPNIVYLIVGSGKDKGFLEALVKELNLQNSVIFAGYVDDMSLPLYYNACDIFIMLTKERLDRAEFEGFGLVFLEANSCCKPVIGAGTGGIADAVVDGKTGYLVDPENSQEIMDKILLLLENRELAMNLGEEGRRRIREGLTWESMAERIKDVLESEVKKALLVK